MGAGRKIGFTRFQAMFTEIFGLGRAAALSASLLTILIIIFAVYWFFHLAPPRTITITGGPEGSIFQRNAEKYRQILARDGVKLKILPSQGSLENIKRLADPSFRVDIGFVQGGVSGGLNIDKLVSLGSLYYEPLLVFYRGAASVELLSRLNGKRIAIGSLGSGSHTLALTLLDANGIEIDGSTALVDLEPEAAAKALIEGTVDAVFLMGDAASPQVMRTLMRAPGIRLFNFAQADGYTRRITYLNKLELPEGSIDFGKNIPAQDVYLIGPTVELVARADLHPALSDLLLDAAHEVHGKAGLFRRQGEFPVPLEHEFRLSADASRFYKSGKSFLYRYLSFWLASLVNRTLVVFVPMLIVLIPVLRIIPALYRWRIRLRIYRWYRALLALERNLIARLTPEERKELLGRLDHIEEAVNNMKMPASFAEQFYFLRGHIIFVRDRLMKSTQPH
ncbi:MAG: TAXI family TRAP transporter solute-binding subunit [Betaproteobacteria bacterium]